MIWGIPIFWKHPCLTSVFFWIFFFLKHGKSPWKLPPFERISGGHFSKHLANLSDCFAMKLTPRSSFPLIAHSIIQVNFASTCLQTTLLGPCKQKKCGFLGMFFGICSVWSPKVEFWCHWIVTDRIFEKSYADQEKNEPASHFVEHQWLYQEPISWLSIETFWS